MAILYVLTISDPMVVGPWPNSVTNSNWLNALNNYASFNGIGGGQVYTYTFIFADSTAMNAWLSANTLSDPQLLADVESWKNTYGVTYSNKFYTLPETDGVGIIN